MEISSSSSSSSSSLNLSTEHDLITNNIKCEYLSEDDEEPGLVGDVDSREEEEEEEEEENGKVERKRRARRSIEYYLDAKFDSLHGAKEYVRKQNKWTHKYRSKSAEGSKLLYLCKHDHACSARLCIFIPHHYSSHENESPIARCYEVQSNREPHDHIPRKLQGIPSETKDAISKLYFEHRMRKPKLIFRVLKQQETTSQPCPTMVQLNNFLSRLRRGEIAPVSGHTEPTMSVPSDQFLIRNARRSDCSAILKLIHELAVYEKMPDQVEISAAQLEEDGFGEGHPPRFWSVVAEQQSTGHVVGFSLFVEKYSTWKGRFLWIEDLYVQPAWRRHHLGEAILRKLVQRAQNLNLARIEWAVLAWNQLAIGFYRKNGAFDLTEAEDWHFFRLTKPKYSEMLSKPFEFGDKIHIE